MAGRPAPAELAEDPLQWLEETDGKRVRRWALSRSARCRRYLRPWAREIEPRLAEIYDAPVRTVSRVTARGIFYIERKGGAYSVLLDERPVLSSAELGRDAVIQGAYADDEGGRMAFSFSKGEDEGTTRIVDLPSKKVEAELKGVISSVVFLPEGFLYVRDFRKEKAPDGSAPPASRVVRDGRVVFGEGVPPGHVIGVKGAQGKALVTVFKWNKTEVFSGDLDAPRRWRRVYGGDFLSFPMTYADGHVYLLSYEGRGFGRVVRDDGEVVVPEGKEVLEHAEIVGDEVVVSVIADCSSRVKVFGLDGRLRRTLGLPKSHVLSIDSHRERAVLTATSFGTPYAIYQYSRGKFEEVGSSVVADLPVREGSAVSKDGTKVHYFEVGREGSKGALVYGYGGFSIPLMPNFDPVLAFLAESGVPCVIANLRGGNEYGERWHEAAKRDRKQNVFDDFAAVISKFRGEGKKVVAYGRSNGGLLVGATLTQHPELLDGAVIGYPVLDMLRFHKLSVGRYWVDEYGDPDRPGDRRFLRRYSPYHNLKKVRYPPTLVYTSLYDDRVHPGHAFKFAAAMEREGSRPLLRVQAKGGHAGSSPRVRVKELADVAAFIQKQLA